MRHLSSAAGIQEALTKPVVPAQGWLRRDTIIIGGGAINRGVETSVCEAFNLTSHLLWCTNAAGAAMQPPT